MITVLFFAELQEQAGKPQLELELGETTVHELKTKLESTWKLTGLNRTMTAVNEEYALDSDAVKPGDTVAFIPPVSGG